MTSMEAEDFSTAETQFKTVIESYPGSSFAKESAKKLIPLKKLSDQDFSGLKQYFDTTSALHEDSLTDHLVYRLKNTCDVEMENYVDAITWFENDILSPASEQDSLFSLIDLSDTYMLMEADSNLESSLSGYTGGLTQYKPKNREDYTIRRKEWINLLFNDDILIPDDLQPGVSTETNMVQQNFPNPFSASTDVSFTLLKGSKVSIFITNLLGQVIQAFERFYPKEGQYTVTVDLTGKPDGIYFISIYENQKEIGKIKALKSN